VPQITVDNVEYELDELSEQARVQLAHLQFADAEIQRLQTLIALTQTARTAYFNELKANLPAKK